MIISVVENLDEPFRSWAKWAYAPRTQEYLPEQSKFFKWLDADVLDNFSCIDRVIRDSTKIKIKDVVAYSVMDYRSYTISEKHLYPVSLIINRCVIIRQTGRGILNLGIVITGICAMSIWIGVVCQRWQGGLRGCEE